jgi:hypothetical protein
MGGGRYHEWKGNRIKLGVMARISFESGRLCRLCCTEGGAFCLKHRSNSGALVTCRRCHSEPGYIAADWELLS